MEKSDPFMQKAAMSPPSNVGTRKRERSNMGFVTFASAIPKPARRMAPRMMDAATPGSPQLVSLARMRPYTTPTSPVVSSTNPIQSGRPGCGARDSSTRHQVTASATTPIGTFTRKMPRQLIVVVITPPRIGPSETATPVTAPTRRMRRLDPCPGSSDREAPARWRT